MNEEIIAMGKIFELVQMPQDDGRVLEVARRTPGVRVIIHDEVNKKVLLTREFRRELGEYDYRLLGGKVFDTLDEFADFRASNADIMEAAKQQAIAEAQQEAGIEISQLDFYKKSVLGATVEWDLYVFETNDWQLHVDGQELEKGEMIDADTWVGYDEIRAMILNGQVQEERIALILLQWIESRCHEN
jgi:hypothetical protein